MPRADFWDEEDEWYHSDRFVSGARHVPPPRGRRIDDFGRHSERDFLVPEARTFSTGLHRTRSQGHSPAPNVTIYNTTRMDNESSPNVRTEQRSPAPSPRAASPRGRPLRMPGEWGLEDELAELRLEVARQRRSRSRSAHHHHHDGSPDNAYDKWQLQMANERLKEAEEKLAMEKREELIKKRMELKYLKDKAERDEEEARIKLEEDRLKKDWELKMEQEARKREQRAKEAEEERKRILMENQIKFDKAEEERKRIVMENTMKMEKAERERKEAQQRAVDEYNKEKAEKERKQKEERERAIAEYERQKFEDSEKQKKQREELIMQLKIEEEKQKAKEKEEWERFLRKQKEKEDEEKEKKKKQEQELEDQMRKRLAHFGFQENQIQAMIKPEEAAKLQQQQALTAGMSPLNPLRLTHQPTYVKVHKDHLAIDTLLYYDIPYEVDPGDPNYIIILREMDSKETEILFEHTRRLRSKHSTRLLIEERHDHGKPDYAWVRRRKYSVSPSRRRSSPKRVVGIKEMFY
ncbi:uncharacterized protein BDR25DRAFT_302804 [Lindgomyces ingoldianus]|uniref:Uncharacterized protein n=1 Tax=Lindgomyces ingoldianus TaxID=673940 RepID=A0ACB6QY96_9PLEO|nr:uncharacterized protein BDR25DRAFT_302804 [Lindgomyces ingoldianus]KAF2471993.1 hypothetical protein BDR25DRAFT_302804 [Lindgomyces ingoldianus]